MTRFARLAGAFFLSGFSALVYELLWFRLLGHVFGSTATAASTLLAAYLFGLGLGAWLFGRWSDRLAARRLLVVYVAIELGIGLYGIASHRLLEGGATLYALTHAWAADSAGRLLFTRFAISFVLVAVPTTLMGGTFPLMVQLLKVGHADVGRATGRAYAVNTAGAALGALALPALLLPDLGVAWSLALAAAGNFAAAGLTWWYARGQVRRPVVTTAHASKQREAPSSPPALQPSAPPAPTGALLLGFFLSSFASLALETVWTRHLSLFFGAQTFTFAFVLFGYLLGLFVGGATYARLVARGRAPESLLRGGLILGAAAVAMPLPFLDELPLPQIELVLKLGVSNATFLASSGVVIVALVLLPAVGFGLVFPALVDLLSRRGRRLGASVALTYVVNTLGTTAGSLVAGFVLVPRIGTQRTLEVAVVLIAAALALAGDAGPVRVATATRARRLGVAALFLVVLVFPRWDWSLAHAQYAKDPLAFLDKYRQGTLWPSLGAQHLSYFKEGTEATVSVCEADDGSRSLYINGKPDASNLPDDMVAQRLLACIPGLFHPDPRRALVIGVGSGTTVATLKRFPLEWIDAAEISPEVGEAARQKFADVNERFADDPRVHLRLDDGRNFLRFQPAASYDLIISEPSNPWMAGVSALFTDEFFQDVKAKLRPGGIVCQWFHYYNMSLDHIRLLARTFGRTFPEACLFVLRGERPTGDVILIGSNGPLRMARLPEDPSLPESVRAALSEVKNGGTLQLLGGLAAAPATFAAFGGTGALNRDDRPILEFDAPADRFEFRFFETLRALVTESPRLELAAGPPVAESPALAELVRDGFAPTHGIPEGIERWRGGTVVTRARGDDVTRWVLVGRRFEGEEATTELFRVAGKPLKPDELADVAAALAGPGTATRSELEIAGHAGVAVACEAADSRTVAIGWSCPLETRTLFVTRRERRSPFWIAATDRAAELALRYPCGHPPR